MTHEKFIELLNLYLDGALPPAEAAALERDIAGNLEHRRIYRQYCQMQNACGELAERFREEASPAPYFRKGAVVELPARAQGGWFRSVALMASGALAACVVFVAVQQIAPDSAAPGIAQSQPAPTATPATMALQPVPYTMTVAAGANPAGFRNPWAATNRTVVDFSRLPATTTPLLPANLAKAPVGEELKVKLQPYGQAPGAPLQMEQIEAAAFQFPRQ